MPTLAAIRKRIKTVRNTAKITKAMKMIAAVKLRKMQQQAISSRAYSKKIEEMVHEITMRIDTTLHPLMRRPETIKKSLIIFATSDRGLCGGFNSNAIRAALREILDAKNKNRELDFITVGRKGRDFLRRYNAHIRLDLSGSSGNPDYSIVRDIAKIVINDFSNGTYDEVKFIYNRFVSMLSQKTTVEALLPFRKIETTESKEEFVDVKVIYEPSLMEILSSLLPRMIESRIYHILLESAASEHAARMTAMDSATNNANEMIGHLTLVMNRARQGAITKELMDIVNGAEAMK
ncbi:MAG: ATP synthase F1 subunit gamma [bacterium]